MLYELIDHELVDVINDRAYQWQDAVKKTTQYLEDKGYVSQQYADAIIQSTEENGPYYVLCPGLAMPHARPETGVLKRAWAFIFSLHQLILVRTLVLPTFLLP